jgi:hypothetical protein
VTIETDSIIAVHEASGAPGQVTDINTIGVHGGHSWHYAKGTPSPSGTISTAVDFGDHPQRLTDAQSLEVFNVFAPYGQAGQLVELFCGQADWCVYDGKWLRWTSLPKTTRDAIRPLHMNHVHVATGVGHFIHLNQQPIQPKPLSQETDDMIQYEWPDGAIVCVDAIGEVFCPEYAGRPTAKHYGGVTQLRDDAKIGFEKAVSIVGIKRDDSQAGYVLKDQRWTKDGFRFEPGVEEFFK